ncbi:hypothetical protein [Kribbella albertanoniae]|uniref:Uncharacterized protein n=1 Tax=Kribbella albertanoniae TaxID=1266829 RepID=A0A4R4PR33_9ACTN|nr:hypothetical protein [Kribbella albertanoniae]TDC24757.1 hypothetical protein E1261_25505 [Kribbella albertanoniae]
MPRTTVQGEHGTARHYADGDTSHSGPVRATPRSAEPALRPAIEIVDSGGTDGGILAGHRTAGHSGR